MKLYHSESWELMQRRWGKLIKDFWPSDGVYDISKVPDIYDCIKFDLQHNMKILRFTEAEELHTLAKSMADIVIPQVSHVCLTLIWPMGSPRHLNAKKILNVRVKI